MASNLPNLPQRRSGSFRDIANAFLAGEGLPFQSILSGERIAAVFAKHNGMFGGHGIYSTCVVLWAFLSQVLRDGKQAACQSAVANVVTYCSINGIEAPCDDTGNYCKARQKLSCAIEHGSCQ